MIPANPTKPGGTRLGQRAGWAWGRLSRPALCHTRPRLLSVTGRDTRLRPPSLTSPGRRPPGVSGLPRCLGATRRLLHNPSPPGEPGPVTGGPGAGRRRCACASLEPPPPFAAAKRYPHSNRPIAARLRRPSRRSS